MLLSACGSSVTPQEGAGSPTTTRAELQLSVLRTPRGAATDLRRLVPTALANTFHIDFSSARLAMVARAQPLFVARGARAYCLLDRARSLTNCWSEATVRDGDAGVTSICSPQLAPGTIEVGGLVPDGVRTVTILRAGRFADATVTVRGNAFVAVLPAGNPLPLHLRFDGTGPRHSTGVPAGTRYSACGRIT